MDPWYPYMFPYHTSLGNNQTLLVYIEIEDYLLLVSYSQSNEVNRHNCRIPDNRVQKEVNVVLNFKKVTFFLSDMLFLLRFQ